MIPRIGNRGHSFKGAGQYFLHDKGNNTTERVAWSHTHNIPTNDPELAMKWMAHTSINRNRLKQEAGVPLTGRKGNDKPVYHFSLAWQPEQKPEQQHMLDLAFDALDILGLKNHEAVFVGHNDTDHEHVHCIVNLVNPENGKTLRPQNDRLKFSTWAEAYEKEHGKIYCEERVINNERRRNGEKIKHREVKVDHALIIQNLYNQAENGTTFQQDLEAKGYTLAKGDRRGFVLVDEQGKIRSLSRQLKGQRAKDIKERLGQLSDLPNAQRLSEDRKNFYRDQYETERQKKIVDAAIDEEKKRQEDAKNIIQSKQLEHDKRYQDRLEQLKSKIDKQDDPIGTFADQLDIEREKEFKKQQAHLRKEIELREFYKRDEFINRLSRLQEDLKKAKIKNEQNRLAKEIIAIQKTLDDIDNRMKEQGISPEDESSQYESEPEVLEKNKQPNQELSDDEIREEKREDFKKKTLDDLNEKNQEKDRDQGLDFEP